MKDLLSGSLLYDFYGNLLTDHQREIYEDFMFNDLSLNEIADIYCITRQGVHDIIKRCDKTLREYEENLGLVAKFNCLKKDTNDIYTLLENPDEKNLIEVRKILQKMIEDF